MSDTRKIVNTREPRSMTREQEDAIVNAFERFNPERSTSIQVPKRDHLGTSWKKEFCCKHEWNLLNMEAPEAVIFLQKKFEEEELGDAQMQCARCGAFSLWEGGKLFAYDAIDLVNDEPVKESRQNRSNNRKR